MRKHFSVKKFIGFLALGAIALSVAGFVVMSLWNAVLVPAVAGVSAIGFWQALGLFALAKILFGGFGGRHRCLICARDHDGNLCFRHGAMDA